jgi:uncharacterized membrane protein YfcA
MLPAGAGPVRLIRWGTVVGRESEFTGTFAGEAAPVTAQPAASSPLIKPEHAAALSKYAVDPNKPIRSPKKARPRPSFIRIVGIMGICVVACVVAGGLLFRLEPNHSALWFVGEALLLAAAMFVVSLIFVAGRRRR